MTIFSHQTMQPATDTLKPRYRFLRSLCDRLSNLLRNIVTSTKSTAVILSVLLVSLVFTPMTSAYAQSATMTPREVVEYALTLEKLEADFYRRAISAAQSGPLAGAPQIAKAALISYGADEAQHVTDLSAVLQSLGGNPDAIRLPASPNYSAILGRDPFANPADLLEAGQYVEDLGVAAYKGQVQNLLAAGEAGKTVLAAALEIHSVEARHAAGIRFLRQTLLGADVQPWIRDANSVIYNENRGSGPVSLNLQTKQNQGSSVIPFSSEAFDGYATEDEVLALVGPILTTAQQPSQSNSSGSNSSTAPAQQPSAPVRGLW